MCQGWPQARQGFNVFGSPLKCCALASLSLDRAALFGASSMVCESAACELERLRVAGNAFLNMCAASLQKACVSKQSAGAHALAMHPELVQFGFVI